MAIDSIRIKLKKMLVVIFLICILEFILNTTIVFLSWNISPYFNLWSTISGIILSGLISGIKIKESTLGKVIYAIFAATISILPIAFSASLMTLIAMSGVQSL